MTSPSPKAGAAGIGFVIPMHGEDSMILETLDSLEAQSVAPACVVVVVDGRLSDLEPVRSHPVVDRVEVLATSSGGPATPRNHGYEHLGAGCEAVCFLDHDDLVHPEFVRTAQATLELEPESALFAFRFRQWHEGTPPGTLPPPSEPPVIVPVGLEDYLARTGSILPSFTVLRCTLATVLREAGTWFDRAYPSNQDFDAFVRILAGHRAVRCEWEAGWYRVHPGSISAVGSHAWACRAMVCDDLTRHFTRLGDSARARDFRRAHSTAIRRSARQLWAEGRRGGALRRLGAEALRRFDLRSLALLFALGSGFDRKVRDMGSGDPRAR